MSPKKRRMNEGRKEGKKKCPINLIKFRNRNSWLYPCSFFYQSVDMSPWTNNGKSATISGESRWTLDSPHWFANVLVTWVLMNGVVLCPGLNFCPFQWRVNWIWLSSDSCWWHTTQKMHGEFPNGILTSPIRWMNGLDMSLLSMCVGNR